MQRFNTILRYLICCSDCRMRPFAIFLFGLVYCSGAALAKEPSDVDFVQYVSNLTPYVGEQILYKTEVAANENFLGGNLEDIDPTSFFREKLGDNEKEIRESGSISVRSFSEVLIPTKAGKLEIPARLLTVRLRLAPDGARRPQQRDPFGGLFEDDPFSPMFGRQRTVTKQLTAPPLALNVKPLPPPPFAYRGFIPVGALTIKAIAGPEEIIEGESITLTIIFRGTANLRPFELPEIAAEESSEFKVYPDKPILQTSFRDGLMQYTKTFKVALVPLHAGKLKLPAFKALAFNPGTEKYDVLEVPPTVLSVLPAKGKKEDMHLVMPEGKQAPDTRADSNKKDVQLLGEDLLPQHDAGTYAQRKPLSSRTSAVLLVLIPLLSLGYRAFAQRRTAWRSDPLQLLQQNAYRAALSKLEKTAQTADTGEALVKQAKDIVYTYLGERLRLRLDSLTAKEALAVLRPHLSKEEVRSNLLVFLESLEKLLYAGPAARMSADQSGKLLAQEKTLIENLERELPNV